MVGNKLALNLARIARGNKAYKDLEQGNIKPSKAQQRAKERTAAYHIGFQYKQLKMLYRSKFKRSRDTLMVKGSEAYLEDLMSYLNIPVVRTGPRYRILENHQLSDMFFDALKGTKFIDTLHINEDWFLRSFIEGYIHANCKEVTVGSKKFYYIIGTKRILKRIARLYGMRRNRIKQHSTDYIIYISEQDPVDAMKLSSINLLTFEECVEFDSIYNNRKVEHYRCIIGLLYGGNKMPTNEMVIISDYNVSFLSYLSALFTYWDMDNEFITPIREDKGNKGNKKVLHRLRIHLDKASYFKGKRRETANVKIATTYMTSRMNELGILFWFMLEGRQTKGTWYIDNSMKPSFGRLSRDVIKRHVFKKLGVVLDVGDLTKEEHDKIQFPDNDRHLFIDVIKKYLPYIPKSYRRKFKGVDKELFEKISSMSIRVNDAYSI